VPAAEITAVFDEHRTPDALAAEVAHVASSPGAERPCGWAWALTLAEEAASWAAEPGAPSSVHGRAAALEPLTAHFLGAYQRWVPTATYPVRSGLHPVQGVRPADGAAGRAAGGAVGAAHRRGAALVRERRRRPGALGTVRLGLPLAVADRGAADGRGDARLPGLAVGVLAGLADGPLFGPAVVSDPRDGQTAHLHGLNLSRAWAMRRLAAYKLLYLDSGY
jgi:hypothetical protein